ncbi:ATP-binding protein [Methanococcus voltae]|uniref:ATPase n=1 Tax=Methanococcus voltae (strain ATCC BAA-1334 / A3) TaxID=456320 RepID=D7DSU2_METV3|nr:ATP-binding protein [Methanococcus voltae]MCS3901803.1 putative AAA+ superfamily ATPase [Methanococcus voltae]
MNDKNVIKSIIKEYSQKDITLNERNISLPTTNKALAVVGIRRSGKTSILMKLFKETKDAIFFPLDDDRIFPVTLETLREIVKVSKEMYPNNKITFFFDEIQEIDNFELIVKRLVEKEEYKVYLTGSSSKLLSKEIATQLRGRSLTVEVFPLSFKEYLEFKGIKGINKTNTEFDVLTEQEHATIIYHLENYLNYGGFPEVVLEEENRDDILKNYLDMVIYKDIVERYGVKNTDSLRLFLKFLINSNTKKVSINKLANTFKSMGVKVSKNTLYEYLSHLNDSYVIFPLKKYSHNLKESSLSLMKSYIIDNGFINIYDFKNSPDSGKYLENAVFLELRRRGLVENQNIFYYEDNIGEVDFLVKRNEHISKLINVCYDLNMDNYDIEIKKLVKIGKKVKCDELYLITFDQEDEINEDGFIVKLIPFWKLCDIEI